MKHLVLGVFALFSAACFVHPAPAQPQQPTGVMVSEGEPPPGEPYETNQVTSGELPPGTAAMCRSGDICNWECEGGGCDLTCAAGATCNLECEGGGCRIACASGATCNVECDGGSCDYGCAQGSLCNIDD